MSIAKAKNCWETSPGSWAYSFNIKGQRYTGTVRGNKREATNFLRDEKERIKGELHALAKASGGLGVRDMTLCDAICRYWAEIGCYAKAADEDASHFNRLLDWIGDETPLTRIDDNLMTKIVACRRATNRQDNPNLGKLSNAYVNRTTTDLMQRVLTRACKFWKIPLPDEPNWSGLRLPEAARIREVSIEEEDNLQQWSRDDYWAAISFSLLTGLRRANVCDLKWSQIDIADGVIRVLTKGRKFRELRITPEVAELLENERGKHPTAVFTFVAAKTWTNPRNKLRYVKGHRYPITYEGYQSAWRVLRKKAAVEDLTLHDLRKTTGSRIVRATGNLAAASKQLGHSSIAITAKHYAHITSDDVLEANKRTAEVIQAKREALSTQRRKSQNSLKISEGNAA
jgi:integrase